MYCCASCKYHRANDGHGLYEEDCYCDKHQTDVASDDVCDSFEWAVLSLTKERRDVINKIIDTLVQIEEKERNTTK